MLASHPLVDLPRADLDPIYPPHPNAGSPARGFCSSCGKFRLAYRRDTTFSRRTCLACLMAIVNQATPPAPPEGV